MTPTTDQLAEAYADFTVGPSPRLALSLDETVAERQVWEGLHKDAYDIAKGVLSALRCAVCGQLTTTGECGSCTIIEDARQARRADQ